MIYMEIFLSTLLYICGIIFLVVLIIVGIKLILLMNKTNKFLDEVERKLNELSRISLITNGVGKGFSYIKKIINKRKEVKNYE